MKFFGNLSWKTFLFGMLAVVWMAVIFFFSSQPAQQSTDTSHWAGRMIGNIIIRDFEQWSPEEQGNFTEKIDLVVLEQKGYLEAPIIVNKKPTTGFGGGVCQVSTTLYNALLESQLKLLNYHT